MAFSMIIPLTYSQTSLQQPPCGQRKVAIVERWPLRGDRGVI